MLDHDDPKTVNFSIATLFIYTFANCRASLPLGCGNLELFIADDISVYHAINK